MKNLSRHTLRKIIFEEMTKLLQDDALFSRGEVTDTGTGTIINLDDMEDNERIEFDLPPDTGGCSVCGGGHDIDSPCSAVDDVDVDVAWENPDYGHASVENISDMNSEEAFAMGYAMGQSGDFDEGGNDIS